jgi:RNA polymerase sigma-70 factor (ECF subfamily)
MPARAIFGYISTVKVQRPRRSLDWGGFRVVPGGGQPREGEPTDTELIDAFERGDGRAGELTYDRLIDVVEGTLWRVLGRRDQHHDDLVQTAFEQIVMTLSRRRFARACSLASWASTVTAHVAFNTIRANTRERRVLDRKHDLDAELGDLSNHDDLEREVGVREELERVRIYLSEMDWGRASTVFLHDVLGHELAEISVLTGVSVAAAQSRLVRGRRELQARLSRAHNQRRKGTKP